MEELPKLFQVTYQEPVVVDHGPCTRCRAERKTLAGQPAIPHGIPEDFCELCYHYVLPNSRVVSDDTYERFELNSRIIFKGTYEDCLRHVKDQKKSRI